MDDEGYVYVVDRLKDVFAWLEENVVPAEVERVLTDHVAVQRPRWWRPTTKDGPGRARLRRPRRWHRATDDELLAHCRERRLVAHKVPAAIIFREALPKNPAGKGDQEAPTGDRPRTQWPESAHTPVT